VLLGLGSLGLIFLTVRRVFPDDPVLAVLALGVAALLPMRQAVTASAGNDPLIEFLFCLFLFQLVGAFTNAFTFRRSLQLGATLGAALLAKANGLLLLPLLALALFLLWREGESPRSVLAGAGVMLLAAMMLVTPWLARNYSLYGELTPVRSFMREFEGTAKASDWLGQPRGVDHWSGEITPGAPLTRAGYLGLVGDWSFRTFWAAYTPPRLAAAGVPRFLPPNFYLLYGMVVAAAGAGLTVLHFRRRAEYKGIKQAFIYLWFGTLFLVAASFVGFVWTYFQAQGRYLYPAILPTSALAAMGLRAVFPEQLRDRATLGILALLALLAFAFLLTSVIPTYGG
jgi:4-amino-4-deoxy-L-arabinose transferase-like glycosyltransferase